MRLQISTSIVLALVIFLSGCSSLTNENISIGSKPFSESVILGEMVRGLVETTGESAAHKKQLGGTMIAYNSLLNGDIDIYPEYTGTISKEILAKENLHTFDEIREALDKRGIAMSKPLGFANNYIIGMDAALAKKLNVKTISDLRSHPDLRIGLSNEFIEREDGWQGLRQRYGLPQKDVRGLDHELAYAALASNEIQATDFYATDAKLSLYDFRSLDDDEHYFPNYEAVLLYRKDLEKEKPEVVKAIKRLEGQISAEAMIELNAAVDLDKRSDASVANEFLRDRFDIESSVKEVTWYGRLMKNTIDHIRLVAISLAMAIAIAIPLGIIAAKVRSVGQAVLTIVGLVQTIPSLVLLVLIIPIPLIGGIGDRPAIFALFVYSLLPIVRNTHAGLQGIPPALVESAEAVGLSSWATLWRIELPLASRSILAGIKTAAVINVGTATLGGFIGAGGFGQPIFQGLRRQDWEFMILQGAIPAAALSLAVLGLFEAVERWCVPRGLRLRPSTE